LTRRLIKPLLQNAEPRNNRDFVRGLRQTITGTLLKKKKNWMKMRRKSWAIHR